MVSGVTKQEKKIESLTDIVLSIDPGMNKLSVKGAFRLGIKEALKTKGYTNWKDLADKSIPLKKAFFNGLLDSTLPHLLRMGLSSKLQQKVRSKLSKENDLFLMS